MPFLAPLVPALIGGVASAGASALGKAIQGNAGQPQQAPIVNATGAGQAQQAAQQVNQGLNSQQLLAQQLSAQNGIQNQSDVYNQQQALAAQLGQMAQGGGPDPASALLANATGQNVAQQAALMAGQRGAGANAGLIARQAAQTGAGIQQQGAGQAAALKQQQQLNAINALQQQQGMLGSLAGQQVGQQVGAVGNLNNFAQNNQGQILNAIQGQNNAATSSQGNVNQVNAANAQQQAGFDNKYISGAASGAGAAIGALGAPDSAAPSANNTSLGALPSAPAGGNIFGVNTQFKAEGGEIAAQPILKENYRGQSSIGRHLHAAKFAKGGMMKEGGTVPGKAPVGGAKDSYKNDVVDAKLSPGEIVLPRSVTMSKDPAAAAAKFVAALKAKKSR